VRDNRLKDRIQKRSGNEKGKGTAKKKIERGLGGGSVRIKKKLRRYRIQVGPGENRKELPPKTEANKKSQNKR